MSKEIFETGHSADLYEGIYAVAKVVLAKYGRNAVVDDLVAVAVDLGLVEALTAALVRLRPRR